MIVQKGNGIRYCICGKNQYPTFEEVVLFEDSGNPEKIFPV